MNLYKLTQYERTGYDTFDSVIVAAESPQQARETHPRPAKQNPWNDMNWDWASKPENVIVEQIGTAVKGTKQGVILASFNAG